jgi:hypothetical protein
MITGFLPSIPLIAPITCVFTFNLAIGIQAASQTSSASNPASMITCGIVSPWMRPSLVTEFWQFIFRFNTSLDFFFFELVLFLSGGVALLLLSLLEVPFSSCLSSLSLNEMTGDESLIPVEEVVVGSSILWFLGLDLCTTYSVAVLAAFSLFGAPLGILITRWEFLWSDVMLCGVPDPLHLIRAFCRCSGSNL